jgi:hypothetical protein
LDKVRSIIENQYRIEANIFAKQNPPSSSLLQPTPFRQAQKKLSEGQKKPIQLMQSLPFSKLLYNQHLIQQYRLQQHKDNEQATKEPKTEIK